MNSLAKDIQPIRGIAKEAILHDLCPKSMALVWFEVVNHLLADEVCNGSQVEIQDQPDLNAVFTADGGNMNYTVVIAEDEELLLHNLVKKVETTETDFVVTGTAQTGIQAYELVKKLHPDLVITDIRMPVMDGIALIKKIQENYPLTDFIITSGYSDFEYTKSAIQLKVTEYLLKPVDPDELKAALQQLGNKYKLQQSSFEDIFNPSTTRNTPAQIAGILKDYIATNYCLDINLNLIAGSMNYSSSYLTKIFYKQYNCSPSKYLISLRMQKAQQILLHNPELSIRQVGESVGYHDQGYFSRIFKKQVGSSPLEYREKD